MIECEKPVALFHGYGWDHKGKQKPDFRGRLQALLAVELYRQGKIDKIVITVGEVSSNASHLGELTKRQIKSLSKNIKDQDIIVLKKGARNTRGEAREFNKLAELNHWENALIIGNEAHLERIARASRRKIPSIRNKYVQSTENALTSFNRVVKKGDKWVPRALDIRYKKIVEELRQSEEEQKFKKQEKVLNKIDKFPAGGLILDLLTLIPIKGSIQSKVTYVSDDN